MITQDIQSLNPGELVELFSLDLSSLGGTILRWHGYTQLSSIWWQGFEYVPWAIEATGFGKTGDSQQPTPTLTVGNIANDSTGNPVPGVITALCIYYDDLVGAKLTRHLTFGKYLDAINFPAGNPTADASQEMTPEVWYIEQKTSENNDTVQFMLVSALDFAGVQLPRRQIVANSCTWIRIGGYRGTYCNYTGAAMYDINNNSTSDSTQDACAGTLTACKTRFGQYNVINFGSFPAASIIISS